MATLSLMLKGKELDRLKIKKAPRARICHKEKNYEKVFLHESKECKEYIFINQRIKENIIFKRAFMFKKSFLKEIHQKSQEKENSQKVKNRHIKKI